MDQYINQVDSMINNALEPFVKKPTIIRGLVHLVLMLYVARIAPSLPKEVLVLFENQYFKLLVFSLVLWTAQFSPSTSLLIAIGFMVSVNYANQQPLWEFLENIQENEMESQPAPVDDLVTPPVAPTKEIAIEASNTLFKNQQANTPVVNNLSAQQETIVIQPSIVQTTAGPVVIQPSVVVAPAIVSTPNGEKVLVEPQLTVLQAPSGGLPASVEGVVKSEVPQESGCYPLRRYDMASVSGFEEGQFGEFKQ